MNLLKLCPIKNYSQCRFFNDWVGQCYHPKYYKDLGDDEDTPRGRNLKREAIFDGVLPKWCPLDDALE